MSCGPKWFEGYASIDPLSKSALAFVPIRSVHLITLTKRTFCARQQIMVQTGLITEFQQDIPDPVDKEHVIAQGH